MTFRLGAAAAALFLAGALPFAAAGSAAERTGDAAGAGPAVATGPQPQEAAKRAARRCRACRRVAALRRRRSAVRRLTVGDRLVDIGSIKLPAAPGTVPTPGPGNPGTPSPPAPLPDYVSVTATEYRLALSRALVGRGRVTVELRNKGEDPHDLLVTPEGGDTPVLQFPETDPDVHTASAVDLAAGRYRLFCSLPGHADLGMTATLRVE